MHAAAAASIVSLVLLLACVLIPPCCPMSMARFTDQAVTDPRPIVYPANRAASAAAADDRAGRCRLQAVVGPAVSLGHDRLADRDETTGPGAAPQQQLPGRRVTMPFGPLPTFLSKHLLQVIECVRNSAKHPRARYAKNELRTEQRL